jgi:predicted nucleic acid-binding Zn ribbon protein
VADVSDASAGSRHAPTDASRLVSRKCDSARARARKIRTASFLEKGSGFDLSRVRNDGGDHPHCGADDAPGATGIDYHFERCDVDLRRRWNAVAVSEFFVGRESEVPSG